MNETLKDIAEELDSLKEERETVFMKLVKDKGNPYWYEDHGAIVKELDEKIAALEKRLESQSLSNAEKSNK